MYHPEKPLLGMHACVMNSISHYLTFPIDSKKMFFIQELMFGKLYLKALEHTNYRLGNTQKGIHFFAWLP